MARKRNRYKELPHTPSTNFGESLRKNSNTYYMFFYRMCEIYMNRLVFEKIPKSIDIPTLMYGLLFNGNACYFIDPVMGDLCLMGTPSKEVDVYNYQRGYYIHTASGYNNHLSVSRFAKKRTGVVIYSNYMHTADIMVIMDYAERLTEALRACDINIRLQKYTKIIGMEESQRLTFNNLIMKYDGNTPIILTDNKLKVGSEENPVYDLITPFIADKCWTYITNIWNDFLTWCGIENATNQKKERLVSDEVNSNYGNVEMERNKGLQMVSQCFDEVNELFGRDIQVKFNSSLNTSLNIPFQSGGGITIDDGSIYNEDSRIGELSDRGEQLNRELQREIKQGGSSDNAG